MNLFEEVENKNAVIENLKKEVLTIKFKKLNGDIREMGCTLMETHLPKHNKEDKLSQKKIREISPEVLCVWDINKNDWRSMRWNSIMEVYQNGEQVERVDKTSSS